MQIVIQDEVCWICLKTSNIKGEMTMHHCLPKHLNPKKNVVVPICKECHDKINKADLNGLYAFGYKITKTINDVKRMSAKFYNTLIRKVTRKNKKGGYLENDRDT